MLDALLARCKSRERGELIGRTPCGICFQINMERLFYLIFQNMSDKTPRKLRNRTFKQGLQRD